jgi:hypothetical protein
VVVFLKTMGILLDNSLTELSGQLAVTKCKQITVTKCKVNCVSRSLSSPKLPLAGTSV